jgi:integrase
MAKVNFNLRNPSADSETSINMVIRWNNMRIVFPTRETINPKYWGSNPKKRNYQRAMEVKAFPQHPEFNTRLENLENDTKDCFRQFLNDNQHRFPSVSEFRNLLELKINNTPLKGKLDLFQFIDKFIKESEHRVNDKTGKHIAKVTIRLYKQCQRLLLEYKESIKRLDFETIDLDFYLDFVKFLTSTKKFSNNTIGKHVKTLKLFLNEATEIGLNKNLAYKSKRFRAMNEETDSIYLSTAELNELFNLNLTTNKKLDRVRDLFIVGCWTGLRFSDFSRISAEHFKDGLIEIETKKTGEKVSIPIHPMINSIMDKYKGQYPNSLPPAISNVKMNEYLKDIGAKVTSLNDTTVINTTKAGVSYSKTIKKFNLLTTHTARRSFATNQYLDGVKPLTIMAITGHRTEKSFMKYIKITSNEHAKLLQLHWDKKNNLKVV